MKTTLTKTSNTELENLRTKLDEIVSDKNADNWWKPELFEKTPYPFYQKSLRL